MKNRTRKKQLAEQFARSKKLPVQFVRDTLGAMAEARAGKLTPYQIDVSNLPTFDAAPYLDSEAAIKAYLADALQTNDPALIEAARRDIARARGV